MVEIFNKIPNGTDPFEKEIKLTRGWLTLNRACNLRCSWCYAKNTEYANKCTMSLEMAKKAIDIMKEAKIERVVLIGGEPTLHPNIFEILDYCYENGIEAAIATNGLCFESKELLQKYLDHHLFKIFISLKAYTEQEYERLTGVSCLDRVLKAIKNISESGIDFKVSTVITKYSIDNLLEGVQLMKNAGAKEVNLSFCYNFNCDGKSKDNYIELLCGNPYTIANKYKNMYFDLKRVMGDCKFVLTQTLPCCVWDKDFLAVMLRDQTLSTTPCQLLCGVGLIFDTDMSIIPCNAMNSLQYGKYGEDFTDYKSLCDHLKKREIVDMFKKIRGVPDEKCLTCSLKKICRGGCANCWTNYTMREFEQYCENFKNNK